MGAIFMFSVSKLLVIRCLKVFRMTFVQKRLIHNGEVAKLTWTKVTDMKIPRYTFCTYCCSDQSLKVSKRSVTRCSFGIHWNIWWGEVTWSDLVTWHWTTLVWNFRMCKIAPPPSRARVRNFLLIWSVQKISKPKALAIDSKWWELVGEFGVVIEAIMT